MTHIRTGRDSSVCSCRTSSFTWHCFWTVCVCVCMNERRALLSVSAGTTCLSFLDFLRENSHHEQRTPAFIPVCISTHETLDWTPDGSRAGSDSSFQFPESVSYVKTRSPPLNLKPDFLSSSNTSVNSVKNVKII